MPAAGNTNITMTLQRQISELAGEVKQIGGNVTDIKAVVQRLDDRIGDVEKNDAGAHPVMESRIEAAWRKIDEHSKQIDSIKDIVIKLDHSNRIMTWIGSLLGSTVIIWLLGQIFGVIK